MGAKTRLEIKLSIRFCPSVPALEMTIANIVSLPSVAKNRSLSGRFNILGRDKELIPRDPFMAQWRRICGVRIYSRKAESYESVIRRSSFPFSRSIQSV